MIPHFFILADLFYIYGYDFLKWQHYQNDEQKKNIEPTQDYHKITLFQYTEFLFIWAPLKMEDNTKPQTNFNKITAVFYFNYSIKYNLEDESFGVQ